MKHSMLLALLLLVGFQANAQRGSEGVGGGDICENRIKEIRDDLASWIERGGHTDLKFSGLQTADLYKSAMLTQITAAKIQCIGQGHSEFPITINGIPKVCKFSFSSAGSFVTCDRKAFLELDESAQYTLIHHEYAGLSQMEIPLGADSTYHLSKQISSYLETKEVKYLAVKKYEAPYEMKTSCTAEVTKAGALTGVKNFAFMKAKTQQDKAALFANEINRAEVGPYMVAFEVNPFNTISAGVFRESDSVARKIFHQGRTKDHLTDVLSPYLYDGANFKRTYRRGDESFSVRCENASANLKMPEPAKPLRVRCNLDVFVDGIYNNPKDDVTVEANSSGRLAVAGFTFAVQTSGTSLTARLVDVKNGQTADFYSSYVPLGGEENFSFMNADNVFRMKASCKAF